METDRLVIEVMEPSLVESTTSPSGAACAHETSKTCACGGGDQQPSPLPLLIQEGVRVEEDLMAPAAAAAGYSAHSTLSLPPFPALF
jgi:hypothetical protein